MHGVEAMEESGSRWERFEHFFINHCESITLAYIILAVIIWAVVAHFMHN